MTSPIAIATCSTFPDLDADDRLLLPALARRRIGAAPAVWDDPGVEWDRYRLVLVRSTWDYVDRRDSFLAWAARVPRLANPEPVLRWNTDKRYLADLERAGIPIVPTLFAEPGQQLGLEQSPQGGVVVKPAVSAGSLHTAHHAAMGPALDHVAALLEDGRVAMVQPYLEDVERAGETALIYIGGVLSHAIRKGAMLTGRRPSAAHGLFVDEEIEPRDPSPAERAAGEAVMEVVRARFGELLYARVDLLPGRDGAPLLLELELTEPSLFLAHEAGAADRLAAAIECRT